MYKTKEYHAWEAMKRRCLNPKDKRYKDYGGRGITVCNEWIIDFMAFYKDMGTAQKGESLDRIDNQDGYHKENCQWTSAHEQQRNMRRNVKYEIDGITMCRMDWCLKTGLNYSTVRYRERAGWTIRQVFGFDPAPEDLYHKKSHINPKS